MPEDILDGFPARYAGWLDANRALLDRKEWGAAFKSYPYLRPQSAPFVPWPDIPLARARLGLVSSAGFYLRDSQDPFTAEDIEGDSSFRRLPDDVTAAQVAIAHTHYPHEAALRDWGSVIPLDALRAKVAAGELGAVGPVLSLSGYSPRLDALDARTARPLAQALKEARVDGALLVPV
jgi:D-proline reductase (dithiol) PrdB